MFYLAAFLVASAAIVGYAVFNQLSFPVACAMMILFSVLLAFASDVSDVEREHSSRLQMPSAHSNHLQTPSSVERGSSCNRETNSNDSNNSNCIRAHTDVQLSTLSARTSASGRGSDLATTNSGLTFPQNREAERSNRIQLQTELRRPSVSATRSVAVSDSIHTPARTLTTPSRSGLWEGDRSRQHVLPQFQRLTAE